MTDFNIRCAVCKKRPHEIEGCDNSARQCWAIPKDEPVNTDLFIAKEDGSFNEDSQLFVCDACYIRIGMPSHADTRWSPSGFIFHIGKGKFIEEKQRTEEGEPDVSSE